MSVAQEIPTAAGFVEVADRVYVARYPYFDVNIGLVLGESGAVLVDSGTSVHQGGEIVDDLHRLGVDQTVRHLVYTHVHFDHTFGALAFDPVEVVAHENVKETLADHAAATVQRYRDDLAGASDVDREQAERVIESGADPRLPDRTFSSLGVIELGDRIVELAHPGLGHSTSDITIAVPDVDLMFAGDLVEQSGPPWFGLDSHPLDWPATLDAVVGMTHPDTRVVPGHGDVVTRAFVEDARSDLGAVAQGIADRYAAGVAEEDVLAEGQHDWPFPVDGLQIAVARTYAELARRGHPRGDTATPPPGSGTLPIV